MMRWNLKMMNNNMPPLQFSDKNSNDSYLEPKATALGTGEIEVPNLFVPMGTAPKQEEVETPKKSLFNKVKSGIANLFVGKETYQREPEMPVVKAPTVVQSLKDIHGMYDLLDTGTTVRAIPDIFKRTIENAYARNPTLPKGIIEATIMKESSMGTNRSNYNPDIGEYAYLVGFTNIAKRELLKKGIVPDFSTKQGAINALADYMALRQKVHDDVGNVVRTREDPVEIYDSGYSSGKLTPEQLQSFKDMVEYYKSGGQKPLQTQTIQSNKQSVKPKNGIVGGVDITRYATDPNHEDKIASIFNATSTLKSANDIQAYIKKRAPLSNVTDQMVVQSAKKHGVPPNLILAIIQNDSNFGTAGKGARTRNPGNYGNDDAGNIVTFKTWQDGVDAVAGWLARNRVS